MRRYIVRIYSMLQPDKLLNVRLCYGSQAVIDEAIAASNRGYYIRVSGDLSEGAKTEPMVSLAEMLQKPRVEDYR